MNFLERTIDRTKALFGFERKSAPDYGLPPWTPLTDLFRWGWGKRFSRSDFTSQVDSLDTSSLVMAVVNDTGTALAEALPSVRIPDAKGKFQPEPGHPAAQVVQRPNPFNVWADYCGALSLSHWIDGNFYLLKVRNTAGQLIELWYLPHFMVEPRWPGDSKSPTVPRAGPNKAQNEFLSHYQYTVQGKEPVLIPQADVIHHKRFINPENPRKGIGAFGPVITDIFGDGKAAEFSATILKNMGITVPLFVPKDDQFSPTPEEAHAFKEKWKLETTGQNAGNAMVMSVPLKPEKYAFSPQELDLTALRKIPESRVASVTRYPAAYLQFLVGLENGTSYASYKEAREQAYEQVVIPIQQVISTNFTFQLLPEFDNPKGAQFFFDTSEVRVLQEDRDSLYEREISALNKGGQTINQFLQAIGRDSVPWGDIYLIPSTSNPMTPERLTMRADGSEPTPEPVPIDPASLAKFAELEQWFDSLERQMKDFTAR